MEPWYSTMAPSQKRTFWACFLGWALDAMDVQLFAFVIPTLLTVWGMTKGEAGVIGTSALVFSALGGVLAGLLADRIGRVRVLKLAILWFALFTGLSAFTNSFHQLLLTRSLQGIGFGGEWAAGAVLIGEAVDKRIRGRAVGSVQSGWPVGYAAAALAYWGIFSLLPEHDAWRVLFLIGILPGLLVLWMRRNIDESEAFTAAAKYRDADQRMEEFCADFFRPHAAADGDGVADGGRCAGRQLHHPDLAGDLFAPNAGPDRQHDHLVPGGEHRRLVLRLHRHGVPERWPRPPQKRLPCPPLAPPSPCWPTPSSTCR